jgi:hypothetical protein
MRWLIIGHPLKGRVTLELNKDDKVKEIMKLHPESEIIDVAVSEDDNNE